MGFFVNLKGQEAECVRCKMISEIWFQTKLLRTELDNSCHSYQVGQSEVVDGLVDYYPLHPWDGSSPLVVAMGDWDCDHCQLNYQWAKVVFTIRATEPKLIAKISEISVLLPSRRNAFDGVHFVEDDLAELSDFDEPQRQYNWFEFLDKWNAQSIAERIERVVAGYRSWCVEIAGVEPPE